ncbi:unnamed protein product [Coffea canephora]|uniref:Uncharacterized protein n=1 Tax=Coffea canephora TaxID=49390 RepID=A0A068TWS3_COFCA|nr:unnamed protein product [Coffea canephora]
MKDSKQVSLECQHHQFSGLYYAETLYKTKYRMTDESSSVEFHTK